MTDKSQTTINPPENHRASQWHWARHEGDGRWFVFEVRGGQMWNGPAHMSAESAYRHGWRYAGPAVPPGPVAKPKIGIPMADMSDDEWEAFIKRRGPQGSQPRGFA